MLLLSFFNETKGKKIGYVFLLFSSLALNRHCPQIIAVLTIQRILEAALFRSNNGGLELEEPTVGSTIV